MAANRMEVLPPNNVNDRATFDQCKGTRKKNS